VKITKTSGWTLGTIGLCVAIAAGGWFGLVDPQRAAAAESRQTTADTRTANEAKELEIEQLRRDFADLPKRQAELAEIRLALPEEAALAQLIRDTTAASTDAGTFLDSVVTGSPVAVVDPNAAVAPAPGATPAEGEDSAEGEEPAEGTEPTAEPSTEPSAPPVDPTAVGGGALPAEPTAPVLAAIPVTITVTGDFYGSTLFLKTMQAEMPRALLVDSLVLSELEDTEAEPGTIQTVITGRVFVFVDPTEIPAVPAAPGAEPSTEPSTEPSDG
jgi:Tfp pilus assembly protein PilO